MLIESGTVMIAPSTKEIAAPVDSEFVYAALNGACK